jgi:hypothetical protein
MRGARVGTGPRRVPAAGDVGRFCKVERYRPAAQRSGAAIGNRYINLVRRRLIIGDGRRTGVCGECLTAQQQAGQQHREFDKNFHLDIPHNFQL